MQAVTRVNAEQASNKDNVGADPTALRGRPVLAGADERQSPGSPTGVVATAGMTGRSTGTREAHAMRA